MADDLDRHPLILLVRFLGGIITAWGYLCVVIAFLIPPAIIVLLVWGWIDNNVVTH